MDGFQERFLTDVVDQPGFLYICLGNRYGGVPKPVKVFFRLLKAIIRDLHIKLLPVA